MGSLTSLTSTIDALGQQVNVAEIRYAAAKESLQEAESALLQYVDEDNINQQAYELLKTGAGIVQQEIHRKISSVVSMCLAAVFDDPYELDITFAMKSNRTEAVITLVKNGLRVDPLTASGGGVVDVAAFALRLACLSLRTPKLRKLLVLDEPFRFLSEEYRPKIGDLLEKISTELGVQIIMVTHIDELRVGNVVVIR